MRRRAATLCYAGVLALLWPGSAQAELPSWLRTDNGDVQAGNEKLTKGDAKGALESYDRAARTLPDSPGVSLDRGLALLRLGEFAKAKDALLAAAGPSAPGNVRADAYENLALSYYRQADALASQNKHEEAQRLFRESVDAAKRSLRMRPGDPNAAWNLELAARRVREEEQKQKQEDDKKKQAQQKKDHDKKPDQDQNKDQSQDQNKDQNKDDQDQQKDGKQDQQKQQDAQKKPDQADAQKQAQEQAAKQKQQEQKQDKPTEAQEGQAKKDKPTPEKPIPAAVKQALDSLQDGEENFERIRARQRAAQERRAPEKDW